MGNGTPVQDFHNKHSLNDKNGFVISQGWIYYVDGASRENASYGCMKEPSKDRFERLGAILRFYNLKLGLASQEFSLFKTALKAKAKRSNMNLYPTPASDEEIAKLQHLRDKVNGLQSILKKTEKEIELVKAKRQPVCEEGESIQEMCEKSLSIIKSIEV